MNKKDNTEGSKKVLYIGRKPLGKKRDSMKRKRANWNVVERTGHNNVRKETVLRFSFTRLLYKKSYSQGHNDFFMRTKGAQGR